MEYGSTNPEMKEFGNRSVMINTVNTIKAAKSVHVSHLLLVNKNHIATPEAAITKVGDSAL